VLGDLHPIFINHFQGTYTQPGNSWDLCNYSQRADETLGEYIQCFSKKRNELPNITDANVIIAFICDMTCEVLIHALSHKTPRTTQELLDITTQYTTGEEVV
jgi:hypothetical protein